MASQELEKALKIINSKDRVCPEAKYWNEMYEKLPERKRVGNGWQPPLPLILAAWDQSSPESKKARLIEHLAWADNHGAMPVVLAFLEQLTDEQWFKRRADIQRDTSESPATTAASAVAASNIVQVWDPSYRHTFSKFVRIKASGNMTYNLTPAGQAQKAKDKADQELEAAELRPGDELVLMGLFWETHAPKPDGKHVYFRSLDPMKWHVEKFGARPYLRITELVEYFGYESYASGDEPLTWKEPGFTYEWSYDGRVWTPGREKVAIQSVNQFYEIGIR